MISATFYIHLITYFKYRKEIKMSYQEKKEMLKFAISLNLFIGLYNMYLYSYSDQLFNIIVGSINIGVWVFFRDMKLIKAIKNR